MRVLAILWIAASIGPGIVQLASAAGPGGATVVGNHAGIPDRGDGLAAHAPGEIIVGLREGANVQAALQAARLGTATPRRCLDRSGAIARVRTSAAFPRDLNGQVHVGGRAYDDLTKIPADVLFGEAYAKMEERERRLYRSYVVSLPAGTDLPTALRGLRGHADVEYVEPNYLATTSFVPNDPLYGQQWAHLNTHAETGWDVETGDPSVRIAVVDSGVAYAHPDLAANVWHDGGGHPGRDFVDIDTAAYVSAGYTLRPDEDYTGLDDDPADTLGHGTHVAGIAAAVGNNAVGVSGVCQHCSLMPVRAGFAIDINGTTAGVFESDDLANAITYAADNGAQVINMSLGGSSIAQVVKDAIDYAALVKGVLVVAAAGNEGIDRESFPAALDDVFGVAATAIDDTKAAYSSFGIWVDVAAPGGDHTKDAKILSTVPTTAALGDPSGYRALEGTSMATPYVAGLAGLLLSKNAALDRLALATILRSAVDVPDADVFIGTGRVNVAKALAVAGAPTAIATITAPADGTGMPGTSFDVTGTATASTYTLEIADAPYPATWTTVATGTTVTNGLLGVIDTTAFPRDRWYFLRLTAHDAIDVVDVAYVYNGWLQSVKRPITASPTLADLDGDGRPEIIVTTLGLVPNIYEGGAIYVWRADGSLLPGWPVHVPGPMSGGAVVGDIDHDGAPDVVATSWGGVYAFHADGTLLPGWPQTTYAFQSPALADLDGDGTPEVIVPADYNGVSTQHVRAWRGDGTVVPGWPVEVANASAVSVADLDGDGRPEIIAGTRGVDFANFRTETEAVHVWHRDGSPFPGWPQSTVGWTTMPPVIADLDNDGTPEIVAVTGGGLYAWHRDGQLVAGWPVLRADLQMNVAPTVADLDQDGRPEILVASDQSTPDRFVQAFHSDGTSVAGWPVLIPLSPDGSNYTAVSVAGDIDGDGHPDVVVKAMDRLLAFRADGIPLAGFPREVFDQYWTGFTVPFPAIGDVDGDGHVDLVAPANFDRVYLYALSAPFAAQTLDWPMCQHDALHTSHFVPRCGDGAVSFGEECDGGPGGSDICTSACLSLICGAAPAPGCHAPVPPAVGVLQIKDKSKNSSDRLTWRWSKGSASLPSDIGDPSGLDHYGVCLYDESGVSPHLVFRALVPSGGTCSTNGKPCWRGLGLPGGIDGYRYMNRAATPEGLTDIDFTPGGDRQASVVVKGKGALLSGRVGGLPAPPLGLPLRAQLQTKNGSCWEAVFTSAGVKVNRAGAFTGKPN